MIRIIPKRWLLGSANTAAAGGSLEWRHSNHGWGTLVQRWEWKITCKCLELLHCQLWLPEVTPKLSDTRVSNQKLQEFSSQTSHLSQTFPVLIARLYATTSTCRDSSGQLLHLQGWGFPGCLRHAFFFQWTTGQGWILESWIRSQSKSAIFTSKNHPKTPFRPKVNG